MASRKMVLPEAEMQQLEQEGFSHHQFTGLFELKALYAQPWGSIMRMIQSATDRSLSAG
jgi:hypothetical protein